MTVVKKARGRPKKKIENTGPGLGGGSSFSGFPGNQGAPFSESVSNVKESFINLRWYLISNDRQFLNELYVEIGLVQTIVNVPVDDGLRGGVDIKSKQLDENQIEELTQSLDRDDDINTVGMAAKWNRLFGGAGVLILTDQNPVEPLDLNSIGPDTPLEFRAVDMWELFWDKQNTEGYDPAIQSGETEFYSYYGENVHKSRVMRLKGLSAPSFVRPKLRGWGFSVVEALIRSMNQYLRATSVAFEVLDEFKVDVYKVKNLVNTLLAADGGQTVQRRIAQLNYQKDYQNAIVIDGEDDYLQKQVSFTGLADAMAEIRMQVAADMRMPLTKLFGISAAGFNSGEDDIEVYNAMVESEVRNKVKYDILRVIEIKCQKLFGFIPDDMSISFKPLRVMSSEQEEAVKTQKFARLFQAKQAGEISTQEFRDGCNKSNLFDIRLDTADDGLGGFMDGTIGEGTNQPKNPQDIDDPGANRLDTRKSRATEVGGAGKEPVQKNSDEFDKHSYEADGGDGWIDSRREHFFENPNDKGLWERAKEEARKLFSRDNWKFAVWKYQKQGGKFHLENDDELAAPTGIEGITRSREFAAPAAKSADVTPQSESITATSKSKKRLRPPLTGKKMITMAE